MKIDRRYAIELAVCPDCTRTSITKPYLDVEAQTVVATNGKIMAAVPVKTEDMDKSGHLPVESIKDARRSGKACEARAKSVRTGDTIRLRPTGDLFPPWKSVQPDFEPGEEGTVTVAISVRLLHDLARAIGCNSELPVTLTFKMPRDRQEMIDAILVRDNNASECERPAVGVLMPMRSGVQHNSRKPKPAPAPAAEPPKVGPL